MKKIIFILLILLSFIITANAQETFKPVTNYYVETGISKTYAPEDFNTYWREGFNLGLGIGKRIHPRLEFSLNTNFHLFDLNTTNYAENYAIGGSLLLDSLGYKTAEGGKSNIISVVLNVKTFFPTKQASSKTPYFVAGVGYNRIHFDQIDIYSAVDQRIIPSYSKNVFGAGAGIGIEFNVSDNTDLYLEGRFNVSFTEKEATVIFPLNFGVNIH